MPIYPMNRIKCSFEGCENMSHSKFFSYGHLHQIKKGKYLRPLYRKKAETEIVIFTKDVPCNVDGLDGPCKVCTIGTSRKGYKRVRIKGRKVAVHRLVWERYVGKIPDDLVIDHTCRNRACCNIKHLRVVTATVNSLENSGGVSAVNAAKTHCPHGHEYSPENTYTQNGRGRWCRVCKRLSNKKYKKRKRFLLQTLKHDESGSVQA